MQTLTVHKSEILLARQAIKIIIHDYNEMAVLTLNGFSTLSCQLFLYVRDKVWAGWLSRYSD